jgi:hypothetical protein
MQNDKEKVLNDLLKNQSVKKIVWNEKEVIIEFNGGFTFYIDSKSKIELSVVEK